MVLTVVPTNLVNRLEEIVHTQATNEFHSHP